MILETISLTDFRNHAGSEMRCIAGRNVLTGQNGQGKTNVLEGVAYLCLGRSFVSAKDPLVQRVSSGGFRVAGLFRSDGGVHQSVEAIFRGDSGERTLRVGGGEIARRSDLIGMFPVVILSPEFGGITAGGPSERRTFVDMVLSQVGRGYLEDTLEYRKALRQRNRLLTEARLNRATDEASLRAWGTIIVERGSRIMRRRAEFVRAFEPYVADAVGNVSDEREEPSLRYSPCVRWSEGVDTETEFWRTLDEGRREEIRMGSTLAGPHRDEIDLFINGMPVREYASQGQQKTLLVALKLAESKYLKDQRGETPLLLLDDVFGELDRERNRRVLGLLEGAGQTFITVSDERLLPEDRRGAYRFFSVKAGTVTEAEIERIES